MKEPNKLLSKEGKISKELISKNHRIISLKYHTHSILGIEVVAFLLSRLCTSLVSSYCAIVLASL